MTITTRAAAFIAALAAAQAHGGIFDHSHTIREYTTFDSRHRHGRCTFDGSGRVRCSDQEHFQHHARTYAPIRHAHDEVPEHTHEPAKPETPEPPAQTCTYKHRIIGVPSATVNAYTARILVSSELPGATATVRAYHADTGQPIDVLDKEGAARRDRHPGARAQHQAAPARRRARLALR